MHPYPIWFFLLLMIQTTSKACPLLTDSPCHCGVKNDSTSYIQCSGLGLREIPKFTLSFTYDELHLTDNYINRVEDYSFSKLRVRKIYLTGNPISFISKSAFKPLSRQLEVLHLDAVISPDSSYDSLEPISSNTPFCLPRLVNLRLKGFQLETLPNLCSNLTRLTHLGLISCGIRLIDHQTTRTFHKTIKNLDISLNPLLKSPPRQFKALESLNMSGNAVNEPFENISLETLQVLDLSKNGISEWIIPQFDELQVLNLDKNRLLELKDIPILKNLRSLSVKHNKISSIAKTISQSLPELNELNLHGNQLVSFDVYFSNSKLSYLSISSNKLLQAPTNLPMSIKTLDLSNNEICSFSAPIVHSFTKMDRIEIYGNPLFCDCNIRWLKVELMRRKMTDVKCSMPHGVASTSLFDLNDMQCLPEVPECVRIAHGSYVRTQEDVISNITEPRQILNSPSIASIDLHYVSSYDTLNRPRKSILVNWKIAFPKRARSIKVGIVPRRLNHKNTSSLFQYSTILPSTSRHFVIHGAKPDLVYGICVEALGNSLSYSKLCKEITTGSDTQAAAEIIPIHTTLADARLFVAASIIIGSVLVLLSTLILLMTFSKSRRRSKKFPLMNHGNLNSYCRSQIHHPQLITSSTIAGDEQHFVDYLVQTNRPASQCCCGCEYRPTIRPLIDCKSVSEPPHQSTTDTRITSAGSGRQHLYHEIAMRECMNTPASDIV